VGIPCEVIVSGADETIDGPPDIQVRELAQRKAKAVREMLAEREVEEFCKANSTWTMDDVAAVRNTAGDDAVIIAADTLVYIDNKVLGKPGSQAEAYDMLRTLGGRGHTVYTGVAILRGKDSRVFVDATQVYFRRLSDVEINGYIATGEPMDKAGAYGVQDKGALLVERVEGDYFTVVGLPVAKVAAALREMGVEVWGSRDSWPE